MRTERGVLRFLQTVLLGGVLAMAGSPLAEAKVIRVSAAGSNSADGSSWAASMLTVGGALAAAAAFDEIWVAEGAYHERISIKRGVAVYGGFTATEAARDQRNWLLHASILDGDQAGTVVTFAVEGTGNETHLDGFTIRNGKGSKGGGIVCFTTSPTIANNVIVQNSASEQGGGIACLVGSSPVISNNTITRNTSEWEGGGICCFHGSHPLIANNVITENYASDGGGDGGGICCMRGADKSYFGSSPTIVGNIIARNRAAQTGGGICAKQAYMSPDKEVYLPSAPTILNNFIYMNLSSENEAGLGGGGLSAIDDGTVNLVANNTFLANAGLQAGGMLLYVGARDNPRIINNTLIGNHGPAVRWCGAHTILIANNLVAFNSAGITLWTQIPGDSRTLSHNCVYGNGVDYDGLPDQTGLLGNFSLDPHLASLAYGNSHLQPDSPCINSGDNTVILAGWTDADGQVRVLGGSVDVGADESDGTGWNVIGRVVRVSPNGSDSNTGENWGVPKRTIGAALSTIYDPAIGPGHTVRGGEVWVQGGTYRENIILPPHLYLYGGFGGNESALAQRNAQAHGTIIDGGQKGRVVLAVSGYRSSALDGFTITNGRQAAQLSDQGGGVECYHSGVVVSHNDIKNNTATVGGGVGGFGATALIINNTIQNNNAGGDGNGWGGGMHFDRSLPVIQDNVIRGNRASDGGGIFMSFSKPSILHNDIGNNTGNGIKCMNSRGLDWITTREMVIARNAIYGHLTSDQGGGIFIMLCAGRVENNLIVQNQVGTLAGGSVGGGMSLLGGDENDGYLIVANNAVLGNKAEYFGLTAGGGINTLLLKIPNIILVNNIVAYNNTGIFNDRASLVSPVMFHNDVYGNNGIDYQSATSYGLPGGPLHHPTDISVDPRFVNLTDDFSLQPGSPCIDAGTSQYLGTVDFDGLPRSLDGKNAGVAIPDIGAFEYVNPSAHGTLAFSSPNYQVDQSQGFAELAVVRTVGLGGSARVHYATSDGTARAGETYVATNGVVDFADQQASAVIRVPLLPGGASGSRLTLNIGLSNPAGALLGANPQAVLTITRTGGTVAAATPTLSIMREGSSLKVTWTGALQSAANIAGSWSDVPNATSPMNIPIAGSGSCFYRSKQ